MLFEEYLKTKGINRKTFELRHARVQKEMLDEYNELSRAPL